MINLLPHKNQTIVIAHDWDVLLKKLKQGIEVQASKHFHLTGWVKEDRFMLLLQMRRRNPFMPIVVGEIDPTTQGCILYLRYKLLPSTKMILIFWTTLILIAGGVASFQYRTLLVSAIALAILLSIYSIAWANFKLHSKALHEVLLKVVE